MGLLLEHEGDEIADAGHRIQHAAFNAHDGAIKVVVFPGFGRFEFCIPHRLIQTEGNKRRGQIQDEKQAVFDFASLLVRDKAGKDMRPTTEKGNIADLFDSLVGIGFNSRREDIPICDIPDPAGKHRTGTS